MTSKVFAKGCDSCGKDKKLKLYPTDDGVIEVCRDCGKWIDKGENHG